MVVRDDGAPDLSAPPGRLALDVGAYFRSGAPRLPDASVEALLDAAYGAGVRWFDGGVGPESAAARLAYRRLVGRRPSHGLRFSASAPDPMAPSRPGGGDDDLEWVRVSDLATTPRAPARHTPWGAFSAARPPEPGVLKAAAAAGAGWTAFPIHLLDPARSIASADAAHEVGLKVLALDPHAGGRLDGSRYGLRPAAGSTSAVRPGNWEAQRSEMLQVVGLGFLTSDRRRTLGQAAVRFALDVPGVAAVRVAARAPTDLTEWLGALDVPGLSPSEWDRIAVGGGAPARGIPGEGGPFK